MLYINPCVVGNITNLQLTHNEYLDSERLLEDHTEFCPGWESNPVLCRSRVSRVFLIRIIFIVHF